MLPQGLRTIIIEEGLVTMKGASKLPKSLTSLTTHSQVFDSESMSCLGFISNFELWTRDKTLRGDLKSNWLSSLLPSSSVTPNPESASKCTEICDYNAHLAKLTIIGAGRRSDFCPYVQEPFFDSLPKFKSLTTLGIYSCGGISCDWLCMIPRNVTSLSIETLTTFPTESQLSTLPTSLRSLELDVEGEINLECDWNDEFLQCLPRSLNSFYFNAAVFPNLTYDMYRYLLDTSLCCARNVPFNCPFDRLC